MLIDFLLNLLMLPLRLILIPIDLLLSRFPDISIVPETINSVASYVADLPATMLYLTNINVTLWNSFFILFGIMILLVPGINAIKKVWSWVH